MKVSEEKTQDMLKAEYEALIEQSQVLVDKRDALKRLMETEDYQLVFGERALEEEIIRISSHLAIPERKQYTVDLLTSISLYAMGLHQTIKMGDVAEQQCNEYKEILKQLK